MSRHHRTEGRHAVPSAIANGTAPSFLSSRPRRSATFELIAHTRAHESSTTGTVRPSFNSAVVRESAPKQPHGGGASTAVASTTADSATTVHAGLDAQQVPTAALPAGPRCVPNAVVRSTAAKISVAAAGAASDGELADATATDVFAAQTEPLAPAPPAPMEDEAPWVGRRG